MEDDRVEKSEKSVASISDLLAAEYQTREELLKVVKGFYSTKGYALSIKGSRLNKYVTLGCDRGGVYRDRKNLSIEEEKKRKTTTRLVNCPFQLYGKRLLDGFWKLTIKNESHNHEPSEDMSGHPSERILSEEEVLVVDKMSRAGIPPRQIISSIRQKNPSTQVIARDIYNMKKKITKERLNGRSVVQALFDEFDKAGFLFDFKQDCDGRLTHMFFAHTNFIKLSRSYSSVFVMDSTYKTNRYKMPLLEIVGITSFNTSFHSCFVFLRGEVYEDYEWALRVFSDMLGDGVSPSVIVTDREMALMKAIEVVFPNASNLLCVWHIEKNILSNCKPHFEKKEHWDEFLIAWNKIVYSTTEEAFGRACGEIEFVYREKKRILSYLRNTWLPYKQYFVTAWTDKKLHFRNHATSRAEGAHSKLKKYLMVSTGDILVVKEKVCLLLENDLRELKVRIANERIQIPHMCSIPFYREVVSRLSIFALNELEKQFEMLKTKKMSSVCTGVFKATMGLPCAHMMSSWMGKAIPITAIHQQWRIDSRDAIFATGDDDPFNGLLERLAVKYPQLPILEKKHIQEKLCELVGEDFSLSFEPNVLRGRGRPPIGKKRKAINSTVRDPSQFEVVEHILKQRGQGDGETMSHIDLNETPDLVDLEITSWSEFFAGKVVESSV
ncbi:hypothetical protein OROMI_023222 [Orobanche minor]